MLGGDGLEQREPPQRHAAGGDEAIELGNEGVVAPRVLERREASLEHCPLQPPDFDVVDAGARRERVEPGRDSAASSSARVVRRGEIGHASTSM